MGNIDEKKLRLCLRLMAIYGDEINKLGCENPDAIIAGKEYVLDYIPEIADKLLEVFEQGNDRVTNYSKYQEQKEKCNAEITRIKEERAQEYREYVEALFGEKLETLQQSEEYSEKLEFILRNIDTILQVKKNVEWNTQIDPIKEAYEKVRTSELLRKFEQFGTRHREEQGVLERFVQCNLSSVEKYYKLGEGKKDQDRIKFAIMNAKVDQILQLAYPEYQEMEEGECERIRNLISANIVDLDRVYERSRDVFGANIQHNLLQALNDLQNARPQNKFTKEAVAKLLERAEINGFHSALTDIVNILNPNEVDITPEQ